MINKSIYSRLCFSDREGVKVTVDYLNSGNLIVLNNKVYFVYRIDLCKNCVTLSLYNVYINSMNSSDIVVDKDIVIKKSIMYKEPVCMVGRMTA